MSDISDQKKTQAVLDDLEPWASEELSRLEREFDARSQIISKPHRVRCRVIFVVGLFCGLAIALVLLWRFQPQFCHL